MLRYLHSQWRAPNRQQKEHGPKASQPSHTIVIPYLKVNSILPRNKQKSAGIKSLLRNCLGAIKEEELFLLKSMLVALSL